jgi:thymidylate synthase (FAD)|tara:strand:+ start:317 stop:997 length:681 start_codon:yes stop_codon:yes gene_type:complete
MKVRLVSYSKPSEFQTYDEPLKSTQDLIAYCAKVSNPNHQINTATHEKLLNYLVKHKHWSPFEMASACLEIQTTRDIAHQIVRHRSFSFQEFSQRYANPDEQGDMFEYSEARLQDPKNRQNSIKTDDGKLQLEWEHAQRRIGVLAKKEYDWAIKNGIAKEQARKVLPEGITKTTLYMNGTIRSWIHYVELRGANGTQQEHMDIAHACADAIAKIFPNIEAYANGNS